MKVRKKSEQKMSEKDIDRIVVEQADDDGKWEEPIAVSKSLTAQLSIPAALAARAAFLARVHRAKGPEEWLTSIIQERIELEDGRKRFQSGKARDVFLR